MKRFIVLICLCGFFSLTAPIQSQDLSIRESVNYINSLLKSNPYRDNFLEIIFTYSIDVTADKELIVKMEFDGPFTTIQKSKISELIRPVGKDTLAESSHSICWYGKSDDPSKVNNCVYIEKISAGNEKEVNHLDNICVMFSKPREISEKLNTAFDKLFAQVLQDKF